MTLDQETDISMAPVCYRAERGQCWVHLTYFTAAITSRLTACFSGWAGFPLKISAVNVNLKLYWICGLCTDSKEYLKKFTSVSDIDLAIRKFCVEIPVSVGKLLKVFILYIVRSQRCVVDSYVVIFFNVIFTNIDRFLSFSCRNVQENAKVLSASIFCHTFVLLLPYHVKVSDTELTHFMKYYVALCTCL